MCIIIIFVHVYNNICNIYTTLLHYYIHIIYILQCLALNYNVILCKVI